MMIINLFKITKQDTYLLFNAKYKLSDGYLKSTDYKLACSGSNGFYIVIICTMSTLNASGDSTKMIQLYR